ncbi:DUF1283 family protein [Escherichia coli]|uniref:DUF1283 family protein n=1 Tax=Escherichia coli TaxID=562 RepID=UPI00287AB13D|nr:DUF1283 family protein [Escherichia coli]MDS1619821.1 DUF1283 family protein [Escherichia coli]
MNASISKYLTAILLGTTIFTSFAQAETSKLVIESGDNALSRQQATMQKEQWNDTHHLRQKINKRTEKEWDKIDAAFDKHDRCKQSSNLNAYWEPNTMRCLDRHTGQVITP